MSDWVLVVDDDTANLKMASRILVSEQMRVSCLKSGEDALKFLQENKPDMVLLDLHMPGMDGFETIAAIRADEKTADIPVIFLTADDDRDTEAKALTAGAMDFIKKPFVPEVLLLRVKNTIELIRLKTSLSNEVEKKTQEIIAQTEKLERLSMQIVKALSGAIDAKDTYTNGHSTRVAEYAREIAKRVGFSKEEQDDIYMMGLLHDIGKIGIPDAIINKPAALSDEEYEIIKTHPVVGAGILKNITELPKLMTGARWHHERYDGKGYPDHKSGDEIPVEAQIIAVADSYDAMSSRRSYRNALPQPQIRSELVEGRGKQFAPEYADAMIAMIDEDVNYDLREK